MGTVITLSLGNLEVDWGKNFNHIDHSPLFQESNLKVVDRKYYDYKGDEDEYTIKKVEVLMAPLKEILPRLELLGYTLDSIRKMYSMVMETSTLKKTEQVTFDELANALKKIKIKELPLNYKDGDYDPGEFVRVEIFDQLNLLNGADNYEVKPHRFDMGDLLENYDPWAILRLLAENVDNLEIPVIWDFNEHMENGWSEREDIVKPLSRKYKFLIVTEGSSDSLILRKAIDLLKPEIADFFSFIDMEEGYPFTGVGNLHNFCQGLVKIGISNNILVIYDNDTEGTAKFIETTKLSFPNNMGIIQLPNMDEFKSFETTGPTGTAKSNINGKAAAIECFLDLSWMAKSKPLVRWSSFNNKLNQYQGELIDKVEYTKNFMKLKKKNDDYNFSKLNILINTIQKKCVSIAESMLYWMEDYHH